MIADTRGFSVKCDFIEIIAHCPCVRNYCTHLLSASNFVELSNVIRFLLVPLRSSHQHKHKLNLQLYTQFTSMHTSSRHELIAHFRYILIEHTQMTSCNMKKKPNETIESPFLWIRIAFTIYLHQFHFNGQNLWWQAATDSFQFMYT